MRRAPRLVVGAAVENGDDNAISGTSGAPYSGGSTGDKVSSLVDVVAAANALP